MHHIGTTKRTAIVHLFMAGMDFRTVARLFRLKKLDVENVVRRAMGARRRRR